MLIHAAIQYGIYCLITLVKYFVHIGGRGGGDVERKIVHVDIQSKHNINVC